MKKNKKGFTLIELLAVIVILAVVMLIAATAVLPMMTKSRKNALLDEGIALEKAAKIAYQDPTAGNYGSTTCYSIQYLYDNGFYEKGKDDGYAGSVLITPTGSGASATFTTRVWISNNTYGYTNLDTKTGTYEDAVNAQNVAGKGNTTYSKCDSTTATWKNVDNN